jgi:hypothetical protein
MKIRLLEVATLCIFGHLKTFGQEVNNVIEKAQSFPDASVVLKPSWIKQGEDLNTRYVKSLDPDRLLHSLCWKSRVVNMKAFWSFLLNVKHCFSRVYGH